MTDSERYEMLVVLIDEAVEFSELICSRQCRRGERALRNVRDSLNRCHEGVDRVGLLRRDGENRA